MPYIKEVRDTLNDEPECFKCHSGKFIRQNYVLMSDPPQSAYKCDNCGVTINLTPENQVFGEPQFVKIVCEN